MSPRYGGKIKGLDVANIKTAFLTHLHSDHTTGYPDLIFTPWTMGRDEPLEVFGPKGIKDMTKHILEAYKKDISYRTNSLEPSNNKGWRVNAHEIEEGVIYKDSNVTVEAFEVEHGTMSNCFGYRFTTPDKVIVLSGDTRPCENLVKYAEGADILIHEVYSKAGFEKRSDAWKKYHSRHHTSAVELGEIASKAKPKLLILYHILYWGSTDQELLDEIKTKYNGEVKVGKDLGIY
jgi:ribonuclease Z